ncbi:alcohol acetyltransferase [Pseudoclavibacter chungangensis]|uniref:Alcohol acetyltransferase n=1 Tax=Pseudoclavibacter chungangensis TaxID=587635 RepID=A0A7J5BR13_9MICO|nr:alcohol acetyltransferase [Pseudoclavibacter chungangensis]KAB1654317.1 alcohol acetyltransferase [Pseudoclavibacter chungangensis]NYJ65273.1 hypothetical protein [Pseudoclavibacter chungangensis]
MSRARGRRPRSARTRRAWVRLDNASNIFLAARTDADPKVFRIGAELDEDVDPATLQAAVDETYARYPLYHAVLRQGIFWYYLQDSDLRPVAQAERLSTCAAIYHPDHRTLLFRVLHHRRRISLEIFHALSDGTGALWFLSDLVHAYARRRAAQRPAGDAEGVSDADDVGEREPADPGDELASRGGVHMAPDSFAHYFRRRSARTDEQADDDPDAAFTQAATPALLTVQAGPSVPADAEPARTRAVPSRRPPVHRVRGTRTPDNRPRTIELTTDAQAVLALARAADASMTMYLTALFFESIRRSSGGLGRARTLAASVPVNLRQFFPSDSARNFFATIRVAHTYGEGPDDVASVARELERRFRPKATPQALERKLRRFIGFERNPVLRVVPRPLKDLLLGAVNHVNNRGLTVAVSNLGRVVLPEPAESRVARMMFHVTAVRPQFCALSHAGRLTISFTSPFTETDHVREYVRMLTEQGVDVSVAATRVTEAELVDA